MGFIQELEKEVVSFTLAAARHQVEQQPKRLKEP